MVTLPFCPSPLAGLELRLKKYLPPQHEKRSSSFLVSLREDSLLHSLIETDHISDLQLHVLGGLEYTAQESLKLGIFGESSQMKKTVDEMATSMARSCGPRDSVWNTYCRGGR